MSWARWVAAPLVLVGIACGSSEHAPASSSASGGSQGTQPSENGEAGANDVAAGATSGSASGGSSSMLGLDEAPAELGGAGSDDVQVVEVPPGPGPGAGGETALSIAPQVFLETTEEFYVFDRAGAVNGRRFALDTSSLALVTFEPDGSAASDVMLDLPVAAAPRGDDLVVLALGDQDELLAVTYDAQLKRGTELRLAPAGTGAHALGGSLEQSVAVWSEDDELHGQLFDTQGAIGQGFDFGPRSCGAHDCATSVVQRDGRFGVVWSRVNASGESMLSWGTLDEQGGPLAAKNVLSAAVALRLADAVALADGRLAVLLTVGSPAQNPLLLFLDAYGTLESTVHVYPGATAAWTMASNGTSLLLAARSDQSQGVVRWLDFKGEPLSDWLIVDDSGIGTNFEPRVALFSVDAAFGAVLRLTDGSSATLVLDPDAFPQP